MKALIVLCSISIIWGCSCGNGSDKSTQSNEMSPKEYEELLIKSNKDFVGNERKVIDAFLDTSEYVFEQTGTGLRYSIYHQGLGDTAKKGMYAGIKYKLQSLEGEVLYNTKPDEIQEFLIGQDNVETGLHEGIAKMSVGSKAIFVLPSHLAHGLSGDNAKIPPQTALVYYVELIHLK